MNLNKHLSFFDPTSTDEAVHIIGVGAMGSRVAELLARLGVERLYLYDFDTVTDYNITNQLYTRQDVGKLKVEAMTRHLEDINPNAIKKVYDKGYVDQILSGYVFLCVDSIELRKKIADLNRRNPNIKAMFDTRMRLTDAQSYGADWNNSKQVEAFIQSMSFTDAEAQEATPISACGTTLSIAPTVIVTAAFTVSNFMNFIKDGDIKSIVLLDAFGYNVNVF